MSVKYQKIRNSHLKAVECILNDDLTDLFHVGCSGFGKCGMCNRIYDDMEILKLLGLKVKKVKFGGDVKK